MDINDIRVVYSWKLPVSKRDVQSTFWSTGSERHTVYAGHTDDLLELDAVDIEHLAAGVKEVRFLFQTTVLKGRR